ncbi:MAG: hypothetical protein [Microviridae sp.]|nr:MAG: hypothetical protein [Microviridae sp.]
MQKKDARQRALDSFFGHHGNGSDPEDLDETPVEIPTGKNMPPTMEQQIASAVHAQLNAREGEGFEDPQEADDFSEDDPDLLDFSPYEHAFHDTAEEPESPSIEPDPDPNPDPDPDPDPASEPE